VGNTSFKDLLLLVVTDCHIMYRYMLLSQWVCYVVVLAVETGQACCGVVSNLWQVWEDACM